MTQLHTLTTGLGDQPELLGFQLTIDQSDDERGKGTRKQDGEHSFCWKDRARQIPV